MTWSDDGGKIKIVENALVWDYTPTFADGQLRLTNVTAGEDFAVADIPYDRVK
jgi:hypothetical protein